MSRREPIRKALLLMSAALLPALGCAQSIERPKPHSSASILESGPQPKITKKEAADVEIAVARSAENQGQLAEAESAYITALKKDPKRADAEVRLAILRERKGDPAGADRHFERALKLRPDDPEILCDRGYSLYLRRRWAESESCLKRALAADPSHARSHTNLALLHARQGDSEKALAEFARAGLDKSDARSNLALVLALEGKFEESRREYALALKAKPDSAHAKEGLQAATVALSGKAGKAETRALARNGGDRPTVDPGLLKTSAPTAQ